MHQISHDEKRINSEALVKSNHKPKPPRLLVLCQTTTLSLADSRLIPRGGFASSASGTGRVLRRTVGGEQGERSSEMETAASAARLVNYPLVAALLAFAVAQSSKFFTTW